MRKRNWSPEEKMAIVLEGIRGEKSIAEICRTHQISQTLFYKWRDRFLEAGKESLAGKKVGDAAYQAEIDKLQKLIGKQTIVIDALKKTKEMFRKK